MSDDFSFEPSRKAKIFLWGAKEMGRGAGWALAITTAIIVPGAGFDLGPSMAFTLRKT